MDDAGDPGGPPPPNAATNDRATWARLGIPSSLAAYLGSRTDDVAGAVRSISASVDFPGIWTAVTDTIAAGAGLSPCRFDAALLLRRERDGLSAVITARSWSVTLIGDEAWVDVEWPSEAWAAALQGQPVRRQIDFPFLCEDLMVVDHEPLGRYRRFHCRGSA